MTGQGARKVHTKFTSTQCEDTFVDSQELNMHLKNTHKDKCISILVDKLNNKEKTLELIEKEKKQYMEQIQKLVKDLEKVKIENKELLTLKRGKNTKVVKSPGDKYDIEDVVELDSELEILKEKTSGFRRDGPQVQSIEIFKCKECGFNVKDKIRLEEHVQHHKALRIKCRKCDTIFTIDNDLNFHTTYEHNKQ